MPPSNASECITLGANSYMPHMIAGGDPANPVVTGTMIEVLDIFVKQLNFCYKFIVPSDRAAGHRLENGTWTGLMSLIMQEDTLYSPVGNRILLDILSLQWTEEKQELVLLLSMAKGPRRLSKIYSVGRISFTGLAVALNQYRAQYGSFSEYLYVDEWSAGYKRPKLQSDIAGFVKPYTATVWVYVLVVMIIMWSVFSLVTMIHSKASRSKRSCDNHQIEPRDSNRLYDEEFESEVPIKSYLHESGIWTFGTLFAQSMPNLRPRGDSERILIVLWLLISLILATVYRSNLKAMLILPKVSVPFDNLQELVETGLPVWVPTDSYFHVAAKVSPSNSTMGRIRQQFISGDAPTDVPWAIRGMLSGEFVLTAPLSSIVQIMHSTFSQTGKCLTSVMSEGFLKTTLQCILLPKDSPWKKKLDPLIIQLRESGILNHIYMKGVHNATECLKPITSQDMKLRPMDLGDFYGVFLIYVGGILAIFVIFIGELVMGTRNIDFIQLPEE